MFTATWTANDHHAIRHGGSQRNEPFPPGARRAEACPRLRMQAEHAINFFNQELQRHHDYIRENLEDMPEIRNWQWTKDFSDPRPAPLAKGHPQKAMFTDS